MCVCIEVCVNGEMDCVGTSDLDCSCYVDVITFMNSEYMSVCFIY